MVWSCKTLQNWKALLGIVGKPYYYELTYNGDKDFCYVDVYHFFSNRIIRKDDL